RYFAALKATRTLRVLATWDAATTLGGMVALSGAWMLYSDWDNARRVVGGSLIYFAGLITESRHAWVVCAIVLLALGGRRPIAKSFGIIIATVLVSLLIAIFSSGVGDS